MRLLLDALISREPWAQERLAPFAGKTALLRVGAFDTRFTIGSGGFLQTPDAEAVTDLEIDMSVPQLREWLLGNLTQQIERLRDDANDPPIPPEAAPLPSVHVQGDAAFAQALSAVLSGLRFDLEETLAPWTGGALAYGLTQGLRRTTRAGARWALQRIETTAAHLGRPAAAEQPGGPILGRAEFREWVDALRLERDRLERLVKRIDRLSAPTRVPTHPRQA